MRNSSVRRIPASLDLKSFSQTGEFQGYASVFDVVDRDGDILAHGAFAKCLKDQAKTGKMPKLLWQHDATQPIGVWHEIREDAYGLFVKGKILLDVKKGREAYTLLKNGALEGLSIGFYPTKSKPANDSKAKRLLQEVTLVEISLVTFAANPLASVTACKARNAETNDPLTGVAIRRLTQFLQKIF
jgi:HK97 family phage prohead protease